MRVAPQSSHCSTWPPSERRCPARRDGANHALLDAAEMTRTRLPKRFAVAAEHIRHF
jgi:hypothetical protein